MFPVQGAVPRPRLPRQPPDHRHRLGLGRHSARRLAVSLAVSLAVAEAGAGQGDGGLGGGEEAGQHRAVARAAAGQARVAAPGPGLGVPHRVARDVAAM